MTREECEAHPDVQSGEAAIINMADVMKYAEIMDKVSLPLHRDPNMNTYAGLLLAINTAQVMKLPDFTLDQVKEILLSNFDLIWNFNLEVWAKSPGGLEAAQAKAVLLMSAVDEQPAH